MKRLGLITVGYTLIAVFMTYPLVFNLTQGVYGYSGDIFGLIWHLWWQKAARGLGVLFSPSMMVGAPFGTIISSLPGEPGWSYPLIWLTELFGETVAFNLAVFASFPLAALTMYLLARHVTKKSAPSFLAGLIYAFCSFHFWQIYVHLSLGLIQWLPLFVLALLTFEQARSAGIKGSALTKRAVLLGLAWGWVFLNSIYFGYFSLLFVAAYYLAKYLVVVFARWSLRPFRLPASLTALFLAGLVALVVALPGIWPMIAEQSGKVAAGQTVARPMEDMLSLSARPWDYFLPAPDHPLLGRWSDMIYAKIRNLSNDYKTMSAFLPERIVFLGWVAVALAVYGFFQGRKKDSYQSLVITLGLTTLFLLILTAPPFIYVKGIKVLFPTYFLYQLLPMFRVYVRLGIFIQLTVTILAAIGATLLLEKIKNQKKAFLVIGGLCLLVLGESINIPPAKVTSTVSLPQSYAWLADQPGDFIIAEYPQAYDTQDALFWQRFHGKKLLNTLGEPDYYRMWSKIDHLYNPEAPQILANLGVKYVVWHYADPVYHGHSPVDETRWQKFLEPEVQTDIEGFKIVAKLDDAYIYEVLATPTGNPEDLRQEIVNDWGSL